MAKWRVEEVDLIADTQKIFSTDSGRQLVRVESVEVPLQGEWSLYVSEFGADYPPEAFQSVPAREGHESGGGGGIFQGGEDFGYVGYTFLICAPFFAIAMGTNARVRVSTIPLD